MALLGVKDVATRTQLSRQTIWRLVKSGDFPQPARIGRRKLFWPEHEVTEWLASRFEARGAA